MKSYEGFFRGGKRVVILGRRLELKNLVDGRKEMVF
jgi:hypothetical protein